MLQARLRVSLSAPGLASAVAEYACTCYKVLCIREDLPTESRIVLQKLSAPDIPVLLSHSTDMLLCHLFQKDKTKISIYKI
jgi:hypothetical protein